MTKEEKTKGGVKYVPLRKSFLKEIKTVLRQKIDFIINNSKYQIDYLLSIDFIEFYEILFLVEDEIAKRAKQV